MSPTEDLFQDHFSWNRHGSKPIYAIIVGAGIAGLLTAIGLRQSGHTVTILERAASINEVGAGIQCAPNFTRIMARFGLLEDVLANANVLDHISLRRWQDDEQLGKSSSRVNRKHQNPLSILHRADLQRILLSKAKAEGVEIKLGSNVVETDPDFEARVRLACGKWMEGHVLIVADGAKSEIRRQMMETTGTKNAPLPTGDSAYRVLIPRDRLKNDEEALKFLDSNVGYRWLGPGGHIMAYPVRGNTIFNMVLVHPRNPSLDAKSSTTQGSKKELEAIYQDWNPSVKNLLSHVPDGPLLDWPLETHLPLPIWHRNKTTLIGDSCHPMLPYVAQGAAQSAEDAGILAIIFSHTANIPLALRIYESVRKGRAELIQHSALLTQKALHLPDGPKQMERDRTFAINSKSTDLWFDEEWQDYMWGVDVMKEVEEGWDNLVRQHRAPSPPG